jgi:PPM family protein phosphatase
MRIAAGFHTDVGRVRDGNEDSYIVDDRLALFAVADGMGGHRGGEVASATAVEALRAAVASGRPIDAAVKAANTAVLERASHDPDLAGMGTTMTAVIAFAGTSLLIAHVGDSRAYLLRDGHLERRTEDHSLVEELVREGRLTPEQAESHPQRAIVTRALGVDEDVDVDVYTIDARAGDRIIVCSDGLTTMLREREVERLARSEDDPQRCAEKLVDAAVEAGGEDNVTVIVLDILEVDEPAPPDPEALAAGTETATDDATAAPAPVEDDEPRPVVAAPVQTRRRRVAGLAFVLIPLLFIAAVAMGAIAWYDRHSWYFDDVGGKVVLLRGRPDALLWNATREEHPNVAVGALTAQGRSAVARNTSFDSRKDAMAFLEAVTTTSTTTTTTTTTTTLPRTTTTRPRRATTTTAAKGP